MFWQFLRALEEGSDSARNLGARIPHLVRRILSISLGRTLVLTERGYFALAPRITEENDLGGVVFGCSYRYILREVECPLYSEQQSYRVVGDTCMAGKPALHFPEAGLPVFMSQFGGKYSK